MTRKDLRPCLLNGERHFFHRWFQEGNFEGGYMRGEVVQTGVMEVGAIVEDANGNVKKVFRITEIQFDIC